jgi:hypothetical protein
MLPPDAAEIVAEYLDAIDRTVPGLLVGLHAVGSIALGDYQPGRSHIDVVAVVAEEPADLDRAALARVHRNHAPNVDGPYVPLDRFAGRPEDANPVPFHLDGHFERHGDCAECNPVTWAILADRAVTVRGPVPSELGVSHDDAAVRAFCRKNLRDYWGGWARRISWLMKPRRPRGPAPAHLVEWGVLGVARTYAAATDGLILSKTDAGQFAFDESDPDWHPLIRLALDARVGRVSAVTVDDVRLTCAFVRQVVPRD